MKNEEKTSWLKDVDSIALQSSVKNLSDSFTRFFKKQNNKPKFKRKNTALQSYTTKNVNGNIATIESMIKLPKLGMVKFAKSQEIKGRILSATIRKNATGNFFVSILCEEEIQKLPKKKASIQIDIGLICFAIFSNGKKISVNQSISKTERKIKREKRKLSRRALQATKKGIDLLESKNYMKQKYKVACLNEKLKNQYTDFLNKLSTELIKNHDIICIEKLKTKRTFRNRKLAKKNSTISWSSFVTKLKYKAEWHERTIITVDKIIPFNEDYFKCE